MAEASPVPHSPVTRWMGPRRSQRSHFGLELQANRFIHFLKLLLAVSSPPPPGVDWLLGARRGVGSPRGQRIRARELPRLQGPFYVRGLTRPECVQVGAWAGSAGMMGHLFWAGFFCLLISFQRAARKRLSFSPEARGLPVLQSQPLPSSPGPGHNSSSSLSTLGPGSRSRGGPDALPPQPLPYLLEWHGRRP